MKSFRRIISLVLVLLAVFSLSACRLSLPDPVDISSADEALAMGFTKKNHESEMAAGEYAFFDVNIKIDYEYAVKWSSSNPQVATVDSNGRVDAVSPGQVVITATAKKASVDFPLTVTKAKADSLCNSTAIVKNESTAEQNKISISGANIYALLVDKAKGSVTAYTYNSNGTYNVPVRAMVCSVGKEIVQEQYNVEGREQWTQTDKYSYQYVTKFGEYCFSSAPYAKDDSSSLVTEEYNKIGTECAGNNIRLSVADAKWIYDNCNDTTLVKVTSDVNTALGIPKALYLSENAMNKNWDPTDPHSKNPYKKAVPYFEGTEEKIIVVGGTFDAYDTVSAYDTCSNPVEGKINVDGTVICNKIGTYVITYTYTDSLMRTGRADRVVKVVSQEEYATMTTE